MRTHQRIGLLAGCLALAALYVPPCLRIATHWPTRPRLAPARAAGPGPSVLLQAVALSPTAGWTTSAVQDRVQLRTSGSPTWVEGQ